MVVDKRHDHSFRVPRPDLSDKLQTNNACTDCHKDKPAAWAAAAIEGWFGPEREGSADLRRSLPCGLERCAERGSAACRRRRGCERAVLRSRRRACCRLAPHISPANVGLARKGPPRSRPDGPHRRARHARRRAAGSALAVGLAALSDPIRGVRLRAASLLAGTPNDRLSRAERDTLDRATQEFIAAQDSERGPARGAGGARQSACTTRRDGRG